MREAFYLLFSGDPETWGIIGRSLRFSVFSTLFSLVPGIPVGVALASRDFRLRRSLAAVVNALTALPTVVVGLIVYSLISRSGPLGALGFLYAPAGIVMGQTLLAFPIVASLSYAGLTKLDPRFRETLVTLGARRLSRLVATLREARALLVAALVTAFGRVTGEVGVCMMLGGNIRFATRTMTTAIALQTSQGEFDRAMSLGLVLLLIALAINLVIHSLAPHEN
ncbi:MAG TPA: ABC transporter permease [Rectinemataceae bacterium]|nr:ABC transporter permease [Rectinemataceae bacterium]